MRVLETLFMYLIAPPIFVWAWLAEQPSALRMAWLDSFAPAHSRVKAIWKSHNPEQSS